MKLNISLSAKKLTDKEQEQYKAVKYNGFVIKTIKNPSEALQILAVRDEYDAIKYIKNPSEKVQLAAINNRAMAIQHIKNPSEKAQIAAIRQLPSVIKYIKNQTEKAQLYLVRKGATYIQFIDNPTEKVAITALKASLRVFQYIKNPSEKVQLYAVKQNGNLLEYIKKPSIEVMKAAMKEDFRALSYIKRPSKEIQLYAATVNGQAILYIKNPSKEIQMAAIKEDPLGVIRLIENPSEEVQIAAVTGAPAVIDYIEKPSEAVQLAAVKNFGTAIKWIENPSEDAQLAAIKNNHKAIDFIKKPTKKVKETYHAIIKLPAHKHKNTDLSQHKHLDQDQIAVIRFMDKNAKDTITVKELKTEFNNSPTIQHLIRVNNGKDLSKDQVLNFTTQTNTDIHSIEAKIQKASVLKDAAPWSSGQIIFNKKVNRVKVLQINIEELFNLLEVKKASKDSITLKAYARETNHPKPLTKEDICLAWVRFTLFKKDVWVDEVQTDMDKLFRDESSIGAKINWMKFLPEHALKEFIRVMRSAGYEKFYMPTHDIKTELYEASPPMSIYKDLPKKMRFKQETAANIDKKINGKLIWSLSKSNLSNRPLSVIRL